MFKPPYDHLSNEAFVRVRRAAIWAAADAKLIVKLNDEMCRRCAVLLCAFARELAEG